MTKKNAAAKTARNNKKGTNMKQAYDSYEDRKKHESIRDEFLPALKRARKTVKGITNAIPGKTERNLSDDPAELVLLAKAAAKFGWGNEFCTVSQAAKAAIPGTLNPDYEGHGWLIAWQPKIANSGRYAGKEYTYKTVVYPKDAFIWDEPAPVAEPEPINEPEPMPADDKDAVIAELTAKVDALLAAQALQQETNEKLAAILAALSVKIA